MCDILRAVNICKLAQLTSQDVQNLLAIMAAKRKKRRSGKFFFDGGSVLASCKTPLTLKALSNLYFRNMKSEEHIGCDFLGYTGSTAKRRMRPRHVPSISNKVAINGLLNSREPLKGRCLNKDLIVLFRSLHVNRRKLKRSEDFNWNKFGLASYHCDLCDSQCRHAGPWFRLMISCRIVV